MSKYVSFLTLFTLIAVNTFAEEYPDTPVSEAAPVEKTAPIEQAPPVEAIPVVDESAKALDEIMLPTDQELELKGMPFGDVYFEGIEAPKAEQRSIKDEINVQLIDLVALGHSLTANKSPEVMRLTLEDCILIALEHNPDLMITGLEPLKSETDIGAAKGEFDPAVQTQLTKSDSNTQASQQLSALGGIAGLGGFDQITSETTSWQTALAGKLHLGTQYALAYVYNKEATSFGQGVASFDSFINLTLTQPLLKGFGKKYNMIRIQGATYGLEAAQKQLEIKVMSIMADVIKAYWDLVGTVEHLRVQLEALRNAERLLKINETRREIGTAADIEVLQAKAGVSTRQSELISARAQISTAEDRLKLLLDLQQNAKFSTAQIVPLDRPSTDATQEIVPSNFDTMREASMEKSLAKRPEMRLAELDIANSELDILQRRNDVKPQLDVTATYGQGGRGPTWGDSLSGTFNKDQDVFSYGFKGVIPIGNRTAEGAYTRSQLTKKQSELRLHQTEQQMMFNVQVAVRNVITNQILMESNRQAVRLQEVNVAAEEKRLRLGTSTSFQVLRIQTDLTTAQTMLLQARIAYEKALIDLEQAEGTLLENRGIVYSAPTLADQEYIQQYCLMPRWED